MTEINQKEYLKKYLSIGKKLKGEKKKKKKSKIKQERLKIVDDDIDVQLNNEIKVDLDGDSDDAPQIVSIIDERPPSLRIDDKSKRKLWKPIGEESNDEEEQQEIDKQRIKIEDNNLKQSKSNSDLSPPRRKQSTDLSAQNRRPRKKNDDDDLSPVRNRRSDNSDLSPIRKNRSGDLSPSRRKHRDRHSRWHSPDSSMKSSSKRHHHSDEKLHKTLDGKKAGLQHAHDLITELNEHKAREDKWFNNLSSDVSGAGKSAIIRHRNADEQEIDPVKLKRDAEMKEKYDKWGKGLKQVEDANVRIQRDLYEMSKPLARYADDEDLENYLKNQEREGDPMLNYLKSKKRKKDRELGIPDKPQYQGDTIPNRYGIKPGHRWDGVDRSNGFEKKWFEAQNNRTASIEDSYKWSTEDM